MKKLYSIAMGLLLGASLAQAQNPVKNVTTNTEYATLLEAFNAAVNDDVIEVYANVEVDNRLLGDKSYTVKGVGDNITITNTANSMIVGIKGNTVTYENVTITSTQKNLKQWFEIDGNNGSLIFNNVTIKDLESNQGNVFSFKDKNTQSVTLNNVKIVNCTTNSDYDFNLASANGSKAVNLNITGDNSFSCNVQKGQIIVGEAGITNTTPITISCENNNDLGNPIVMNCSDPSKFNLTTANCSLYAEGGNLMVDRALLTVTTDIEGAEINGKTFNDITPAILALSSMDPLPGTATLAFNMDLSFGTRFDAFPAGFDIVITSADPQNPVTFKTTTGADVIGVLANKNGRLVTFKDIIVDANGTTRTKQIFEATSSCGLRLENVTINNAKMSETDGVYINMFRSTSGGYFQLVNVTFGETSDQQPLVFCGTSKSSISGTINVNLNLDKTYSINGEGWTPSQTCDIFYSETPGTRANVVTNFTDLDKLNLLTEGYMLYVKDGNVMITTEDDTEAGIDVVELDANAPVEYFNLQGVRVANPAAGALYIKRQGNTVTKVSIK